VQFKSSWQARDQSTLMIFRDTLFRIPMLGEPLPTNDVWHAGIFFVGKDVFCVGNFFVGSNRQTLADDE
jgi:hypothetical protein